MPVNFYSFAIGASLAEREFEEKGVPNSDRARQLGLLAALFSPGDGGGLGSSVLPAVLVQQTARREAEEAAAAKARDATTFRPGADEQPKLDEDQKPRDSNQANQYQQKPAPSGGGGDG